MEVGKPKTIMNEMNPHRCTDFVSELMLTGVEEILGTGGLDPALAERQARLQELRRGETLHAHDFPEYDLDKIQQALGHLFGVEAGSGLALRAGRASLQRLLSQYGAQLGITSLGYRLLPSRARFKTGLEALAGFLSAPCGGQITISEDANNWYWRIESCPWCLNGESGQPACHFVVGLLQEFLSWASGGRFFQVTETECQAMGAPACLIQMNKQPID